MRLRLLGQFGLEVDGDDRGAAIPVRARALLAYLVVRAGVWQARSQLAALLWPASADGQARTNLRNVVHHLRRAEPGFGACVEVAPTTLRWVGGPGCSADLADFVAAVTAAGNASDGSPEQIDQLRTAVARYEGDLLEGAPDECLDDDRIRLREMLLDALRRLTQLLPGGAEAVAAARELVRRDPLNEEHHRLLMTAHAAGGDRAGAVRAYHGCVAVLRQELGVEPSARTRTEYARLVDVGAAPARLGRDAERPGREATSPGTVVTPLVGREAEWAELSRHWRMAATGRPHLVVVTGEPGVGKTRLVEQLASRCARQGAWVATARSYPSEGELGYGVVIEWLRSPRFASLVRGAAASDRRHLARLLPDLDATDAPRGPVDEADRKLLFDAVTRILAGADRPVLLVADDAQWCDAPSLALIHYLVRSVPRGAVLVVATARAEDVGDHHPLATVTADLQMLDRASDLLVGRLDAASTTALARALGAPNADQEQLFAETEGNPLFVVEAVRAGWDGAGGGMGLTPKLQAVIATRLRRLSSVAVQVTQVAATVGRNFRPDLLRSAGGFDETAIVTGLDELWRRGIIRSHDHDRYDFSHGKIREVAYAAMSPAVRAQRHLAVAQALASSGTGRLDDVSGQIAAHFDEAGRVEDAIVWYERAVAPALRMGAHAEAYRMLQRALTLVATLPEEVGARQELRLLARVPAALGGIDGYASDRFAALHQRATTVASRLGVELQPPLLRSIVMASLCRDEFEQAGAAADRLLIAAERAEDDGLAIESVYMQAIVAFWSGDLPTAATRFRDVADRFDADRRGEHILRFGQDPQVVCLSRLANALWFLGHPVQAATVAAEALALAERVGDPVSTDIAHIFAALLAADLDDAEAFCRAAVAFGDSRPRGGPFLIKGEALQGYADVLQGRAEAGIGRIERAVRLADGHNFAPGFVPTLHRIVVGAYDAARDPAGGLAAADQALALGGTRLWEPEIRRLRARFLAGLARPAPQVAAELDYAMAAAARLHAPGAATKVDATRKILLAPTPHKRSRNDGLRTLSA